MLDNFFFKQNEASMSRKQQIYYLQMHKLNAQLVIQTCGAYSEYIGDTPSKLHCNKLRTKARCLVASLFFRTNKDMITNEEPTEESS